MIVEFSVKNFRSIKELQTISFVATSLDSNQEKYPEVDKNNIAEEGGMRLLKTVGIFGANASGKSNIIRALEVFLEVVTALPSRDSRLGDATDPFLFQDSPFELDTFFQIVLVLDGKKYRYGFTVRRNPLRGREGESNEIITAEWLFGNKKKNQSKVFLRDMLEVDKGKLPNAKAIPNLPSEHVLYLTHAASFDRAGLIGQIWVYLASFTISNHPNQIDILRSHTFFMLSEAESKKQLLDFFGKFGLFYDGVEIELEENESVADAFKRNNIFLVKTNPNSSSKPVRLNLAHHESDGTRKLFDMAGLLFRAGNMRMGGLLILDELDSNFHPSLVRRLIEHCNNKILNPINFQILFSSHDTNLLDPSIMRRDQFYFTEKDLDNATQLYSLSSLNGIRNDADFARQYLSGYYGGLPKLSSFISQNIGANE